LDNIRSERIGLSCIDSDSALYETTHCSCCNVQYISNKMEVIDKLKTTLTIRSRCTILHCVNRMSDFRLAVLELE